MKKLTPFQKRILTAVLVITLAASGYFLSKVIESRMKRSEFSNLLLRTQMIALLIDSNDIQQLSGDLRDIDDPTYLSLKRRLIEVKKIDNDAQYIYLLGLNASRQQFYFMGSELTTSDRYIEPGTINQQATEKDIRDHIGGAIHVSERTNNSGKWVSTYAPIRTEQGDVVAVVRMDIDSQKITLIANIVRRGILLITALMIFSILLIYINGTKKIS